MNLVVKPPVPCIVACNNGNWGKSMVSQIYTIYYSIDQCPDHCLKVASKKHHLFATSPDLPSDSLPKLSRKSA